MWASTQLRNCECSHLLTSFSSCNPFRVTGRRLQEQGYRKGVTGKGLQEQGYGKGLQEEGLQEAKRVAGRGCRKRLQEGGCRSRVAGRGYRKRVAGAGLQEGVAGRGVTGSKKGCRKGLRERRHSRNPLTQPLFGGATTILRQLLPATTTTSCDNLQRPIMLFTCVPGIWQQVPESNQNCSDNYKTKQPLTTTISPDPISDPIGAVLDYFGLLSLDISIADCACGCSGGQLRCTS